MKNSPYPYWLIVTYTGRLPVPLEFKGTPIAREFESGRIGGKKSQENKAFNLTEALRLFNQNRFGRQEPEVFFVPGPAQLRRKVQHPDRELQSQMVITNLELLNQPSCKFILNDHGLAKFQVYLMRMITKATHSLAPLVRPV